MSYAKKSELKKVMQNYSIYSSKSWFRFFGTTCDPPQSGIFLLGVSAYASPIYQGIPIINSFCFVSFFFILFLVIFRASS